MDLNSNTEDLKTNSGNIPKRVGSIIKNAKNSKKGSDPNVKIKSSFTLSKDKDPAAFKQICDSLSKLEEIAGTSNIPREVIFGAALSHFAVSGAAKLKKLAGKYRSVEELITHKYNEYLEENPDISIEEYLSDIFGKSRRRANKTKTKKKDLQ